MEVTSYSKFRQNLKSYMDKVVHDSNPLYVTRANGEDVVVISKSDYESMDETTYLLSSPKNRERLLNSVEEFKMDKGIKKDMDDLTKMEE
ncbi:MAG: type II toxin-antitoxin system prevent-host-death family antitoxin [Ekhidna sp.]|nr:type II toxin-antitoxin system prevent-host-death family antitoxin [Ekhidna sp.]